MSAPDDAENLTMPRDEVFILLLVTIFKITAFMRAM